MIAISSIRIMVIRSSATTNLPLPPSVPIDWGLQPQEDVVGPVARRRVTTQQNPHPTPQRPTVHPAHTAGWAAVVRAAGGGLRPDGPAGRIHPGGCLRRRPAPPLRHLPPTTRPAVACHRPPSAHGPPTAAGGLRQSRQRGCDADGVPPRPERGRRGWRSQPPHPAGDHASRAAVAAGGVAPPSAGDVASHAAAEGGAGAAVVGGGVATLERGDPPWPRRPQHGHGLLLIPIPAALPPCRGSVPPGKLIEHFL